MLVASVTLVALGTWTYRQVETSVRELRASTMRSLLDSEVNALRVWIAEEIGDVERIVRDARVRKAIVALVRDRPCAAAPRARLEEVLRPLLRDVGDATFNVVDRRGRLMATRFPDYCGLSVNAERFLPQLAPVFAGGARFVRPFHDRDRIAGAPRLREGPPFAWIAAPVHDVDGGVVAALSVAEPVGAVFASILQSARPGETGEAFAFDERGAILTLEHFGEIAPLHARLRESEAGGVILDPYVNHRGVEVVGAGRWLPEYDMGVGLEIEAAEAYAPLRYLNIAFGTVFGALVIAVFAAAASARSVIRLRREIGAGRKVGAYRLLERIGEGGMANVYLARHDLLKRPAAVKILKLTHTSDEMIGRFQREAHLAASLAHPNTVEIFDYGSARGGELYYAMEYLDGLTLGEILAREPLLPIGRTMHLLRQVCAALVEAHGKGLVHRDIKPENTMVCRYGGIYDHVKILDFGLVKQLSGKHSRDLTRGLRILGTPLYMAPERLRNPADVDARADIYSVGAMAYLMVSGRKPFEADNDLSLTSAILNDAAPALDEAAPSELRQLTMRCLAKRREDRPQTIAELVEAFEALALEHRWTQRDAEAWWAGIPSRTIIG